MAVERAVTLVAARAVAPTHVLEDTTMQRRTFVEVTMPALLGASLAPGLLRDTIGARELSATDGPARPFVLAPGEGRTAAPLLVVGETGLAKLRADDCGGQLCLFHFVAPPRSGPPLHRHSREDECFYVLDGELVFQLDGVRHTVGPGGMVYSPRGVVHAYQNFTTSDARLLIATMPGAFGVMFEEMSAATPPGGMPSMEVLEALHRNYGITTMGPPLAA
jgi:quercetin dioxygenase-like cupin family protein